MESKINKYKKRILAEWIVLLGISIVFSGVFSKKFDVISFVINIVFFALIFAILFYANKNYLVVTESIVDDLKNAKNKIIEDYENKHHYLYDDYKDASLFENDVLKGIYKNYIEENERILKEEQNYKCSIEDYINYDLIDLKINRNYMNLISGIMTGLGILGTFIGLSLGLQSFQTGSSEQIINSIAPLMDGIKVAFHTSVYGMCFSLTINGFYKLGLEDAYKSVDEFIEVYYQKVAPNSSNEIAGSLMEMQNKQLQGIYAMSEVIADKMASKINELLTPQFEKMNDVVERVAEITSKNQVEGVAKIVEQFTASMDNSLGESFAKLDENIKATCKWQENSMAEMTKVLEEIKEMSFSLYQINELSAKTIQQFEEHISKVTHLQNLINQNVEKQISVNDEINTTHLDQIKMLRDIESSMQSSIKTNLENIQGIFTELQTLQNELITDMKDSNSQVIELSTQKLDEFTKQVNNVTEKINSTTKATIEVLEEKSKAINELSIQQLQNVTQHVTEVTENINKNVSETVNTLEQKVNEINNSSITKLTEFTENVEKINEDISNNAIDTMRVLQEETKKINQSIRQDQNQYIQEVANLGKQVNEGLITSSNEMSKISKDFKERLQGSLENTFDNFDINLTKISNHLSGTIAEIQETTKLLPRVINNAYDDGVVKGFDELNKQMIELAKQVQQITKIIEKDLKNITGE